MRKARLGFAVMAAGSAAAARESWVQTLVLVRSLRRFGGEHGRGPVLVLFPDTEGRRAGDLEARVEREGAEILPVSLDPETLGFPFAAKVAAAAVAEERLLGRADALFWMDPDTLVLSDLAGLVPGGATDLCYRPVHITNVGSRFDEPVDPFWAAIYSGCHVAEEAFFPMETCVEGAKVRPYLNAGCLVVRPEKGILRAWAERFSELRGTPALESFYTKDRRYAIFVHQAVLAGTVLATVGRPRMRELPESVNYPRHLHETYDAARRPKRLNDLVTCRYEESFPVNRWESDLLPVDEPLLSWIRDQLLDVEPLLDSERTARLRAELDLEGIRV